MTTKGKPNALSGTTLKVYRFLYREGKAIGIRELQRGMNLSSSSVAQYHIKKLLELRLAREENGGYIVDKIMFENMIRIRRSLIPVQFSYAVFFATLLVTLIISFGSSYSRNASLFIFALVVTLSALVLFSLQAFRNGNNQ